MKINIINDTDYKFIITELKNIIICICKKLELKNIEINYRFTTDEIIIDYNKKFFDFDSPTDVIAFPDGETKLEKDVIFLGDIIISIDTVQKNSEIFNCLFSEELFRVMIHGLLHIIGYKDDTAKNQKVMFDLQEKLLKEIVK